MVQHGLQKLQVWNNVVAIILVQNFLPFLKFGLRHSERRSIWNKSLLVYDNAGRSYAHSHIDIRSSIYFISHLWTLWWVISRRSMWLTSRNVGVHCCVCTSKPRLHQSHLVTALGLPACNFMAQKYNVSFCQHSLLIEACSFTVISKWCKLWLILGVVICQ